MYLFFENVSDIYNYSSVGMILPIGLKPIMLKSYEKKVKIMMNGFFLMNSLTYFYNVDKFFFIIKSSS